MITKIMMWVSIVVVLLALSGLPVTSGQILVEIVVCASALLVIRQAVRADQYLLAIGFLQLSWLSVPSRPLQWAPAAFAFKSR